MSLHRGVELTTLSMFGLPRILKDLNKFHRSENIEDRRKKLFEIYSRPNELFVVKRNMKMLNNSKRKWDYSLEEYTPTEFTSERVLSNPEWADVDIPKEKSMKDSKVLIKWNQLDNGIIRISYEGEYSIDEYGRPRNPSGRTGLSGRGYLGKWATNHAADALITRCKVDDGANRDLTEDEKTKSQYEFIAIKRKNGGEWALPGGMLDNYENAYDAMKREFLEEVFDLEGVMKNSSEDGIKLKEKFDNLLAMEDVKLKIVDYGLVDDPRNTDNAWIESMCFNYHIPRTQVWDDFLKEENLVGGSDSTCAKWMDVKKDIPLFASHTKFLNTFLLDP